jgi:4-hydroxy-3-methylbut-2-en-1-yl diphosphate reductase
VRRALWGRTGVEVAVTGMGPEAAARAAREWVGRVGAVVVCGVAGGCGGVARAGDLVVASRLIDARGQELGPVRAVELPGAVLGTVAAVESPVSDAAGLAELCGLGAVAVETESAGWVGACAAAGIPLAVVRAVLDTPEAPLGAAASLVRPGAAGPSPGEVLRLLGRPGTWPRMVRLGRASARAERLAAQAAIRVMAELGPWADLPVSRPTPR